jgi:hypothetical protein
MWDYLPSVDPSGTPISMVESCVKLASRVLLMKQFSAGCTIISSQILQGSLVNPPTQRMLPGRAMISRSASG